MNHSNFNIYSIALLLGFVLSPSCGDHLPLEEGHELSFFWGKKIPNTLEDRWDQKSFPIRYSLSDDEFTPELQMQIRRAIKTWELTVGFTLFEEVPDPGRPLSCTKKEALENEVLQFLNRDENCPYHQSIFFPWTILTVAMTSPLRKSRFIGPDTILSADIWFNAQDYNFGDIYSMPPPSGDKIDNFDLETIALHELGHVLRLAHVSSDLEPDSVMISDISIKVTAHIPSPKDIMRMHQIYGCEKEACDVHTTHQRLKEETLKGQLTKGL